MSQFIYAYHGGEMASNPEDQAKQMEKWAAWFGALGPALINPGNPVGISKTVGSDGVVDNGGANPISGYTIVEADNMDAAIEMAKGCPLIENGSVEVAELMDM